MFEGRRGGKGGGALEGRPDDKKELTGDGGRRVDAEPAEEEVVREFNLEEMSPRD